jgi:hypothetical protein
MTADTCELDGPDALSEGRRLTTAEDALRFLLAGNATVTLKSLRTGVHYTYKVQAPKDPRPGDRAVHFVKLLTGPQNEADYTYLGAIFEGKYFRLTKASKVSSQAPSLKAFAYVWDRLATAQPLPPGVEVWHEGSCGRCGRTLTVPESVERGIGPECAVVMGLL